MSKPNVAALLRETVAPKKEPATPTIQVRDRLWDRFAETVLNGYWFCADCQAIVGLDVSDHGLPNRCDKCGSYNVPREEGVEA